MKLTAKFQIRQDKTNTVQSEHIEEFEGDTERDIFNQYYDYLWSRNKHPFMLSRDVNEIITTVTP